MPFDLGVRRGLMLRKKPSVSKCRGADYSGESRRLPCCSSAEPRPIDAYSGSLLQAWQVYSDQLR